MSWFYTLSDGTRIAFSVGALLCAMLQAVAAAMQMEKHGDLRTRIADSVPELLCFAHAVSLVVLIAFVQLNVMDGIAVAPRGYAARYVLFGLLAAAVLKTALGEQHPEELPAILAAALTLPVVETVSGAWFPLLYAADTLCFSLRAAVHAVQSRRALRTGISAISLKTAIDALHTGILFCEQSGYIVLCNRRMLRLMAALTGAVQRDGRRFYELLCAGCGGGQKLDAQQGVVYRLADGSVWMFTKDEIADGRRTYVQLAASDITADWALTEELQAQDAALRERSAALKQAIETAAADCRAEETLRLRGRLHALLGQRVALLLRALQEEREPDAASLAAFARGLAGELARPEPENTAAARLEAIRRTFEDIGVRLSVTGELPRDPAAGLLLADIVAEAATNAVRHAFADAVFVRLRRENGEFCAEIADSGIPPSGKIAEGGGLTEMRRRLRLAGGALEVRTSPRFTLKIRLPEGDAT